MKTLEYKSKICAKGVFRFVRLPIKEGIIMLIDDRTEYDLIWNKVYETLKFNPSMKNGIVPFEIKEEHSIYSFDIEIDENQIDKLNELMKNIFADIANEDTKMYALDWQHSAFLYNPKNEEEQKSIWKKDDRYMGGGYNAYFPSFLPDGDYYFFIEENFRFGYLGHPWRREIWVWGEELIAKMDEIYSTIGFNKIK